MLRALLSARFHLALSESLTWITTLGRAALVCAEAGWRAAVPITAQAAVARTSASLRARLMTDAPVLGSGAPGLRAMGGVARALCPASDVRADSHRGSPVAALQSTLNRPRSNRIDQMPLEQRVQHHHRQGSDDGSRHQLVPLHAVLAHHVRDAH